jgi:hypothetical protein
MSECHIILTFFFGFLFGIKYVRAEASKCQKCLIKNISRNGKIKH